MPSIPRFTTRALFYDCLRLNCREPRSTALLHSFGDGNVLLPGAHDARPASVQRVGQPGAAQERPQVLGFPEHAGGMRVAASSAPVRRAAHQRNGEGDCCLAAMRAREGREGRGGYWTRCVCACRQQSCVRHTHAFTYARTHSRARHLTRTHAHTHDARTHTHTQRVIPLLQTGFHDQQHLLWKQMDRVRTRDSAYVPRGGKSPRTGSPNPVRATYHRTASQGDMALDPSADNDRPQYFYESEPVLTPVCHTSLTPRPPTSARSPRGVMDVHLMTRRPSSERTSKGLQPALLPSGSTHPEALVRQTPRRALRPTSAPSSRKQAPGQRQRPWSASAATRQAPVKSSAGTPGRLHLDMDALADARVQERREEGEAGAHGEQAPRPSSRQVTAVHDARVRTRASCLINFLDAP